MITGLDTLNVIHLSGIFKRVGVYVVQYLECSLSIDTPMEYLGSIPCMILCRLDPGISINSAMWQGLTSFCLRSLNI